MNQQARKMQQITIGIWGVAVVLFIIESILKLYPAFFHHSSRSLLFNDAIKQLVIILLYALVAFNLFRLIYTRKGAFINLVSEDGVKQIKKIWSSLIIVLLAKLILNQIIVWFVLPRAEDANLAESLGYFRHGSLKLQPHADLIIAIIMAWIFLLVLNYALQLKKEQDLTI